jgi:hypothetical protein
VIVTSLIHQLEVMFIPNQCQLILSRHYHIRLSKQLILNLVLLIALLIQLFLYTHHIWWLQNIP